MRLRKTKDKDGGLEEVSIIRSNIERATNSLVDFDGCHHMLQMATHQKRVISQLRDNKQITYANAYRMTSSSQYS